MACVCRQQTCFYQLLNLHTSLVSTHAVDRQNTKEICNGPIVSVSRRFPQRNSFFLLTDIALLNGLVLLQDWVKVIAKNVEMLLLSYENCFSTPS